ncbi:MAG: hypothetical protein GY797_36455, partial [Deltaproteobacteria bacterium]|nr:hypothetical protein [Deltaproteobacteria bacterium]
MPGVFWALIKKPSWLQVLTKHETSWSSQAEVSDWNNNIPTLQDDGAHFDESPFYFEWWYFDATFGEGSTISIIFHLTDLINPLSKTGSIDLSVFDHGKLVLQRFIPYAKEQIHASSDVCDVQIGKSRCFIENDVYKIHIEEPEINADLTFESASVGWRPGSGRFNFGHTNSFFSWIVPQPRAQVKGRIVIQGQERMVSGAGYHDHNWGTASLLDTVDEWSWGRIYLEDYTCIFADIQLSPHYGGARVLPFSMLRGNQVLISSFLQANQPIDPKRDFLSDPRSVDSPAGWHLQWEEQNKQLDLTLKT